MIETFGAFSRNPLYNELQVRKSVPVSAKVRLLYSREDLKEKSVKELSDGLDKAFSFDQFRWQRENGIQITDGFRADGLERILYKCPHCGHGGGADGQRHRPDLPPLRQALGIDPHRRPCGVGRGDGVFPRPRLVSLGAGAGAPGA